MQSCYQETVVWLQHSVSSQCRDGSKYTKTLSDFENWFMAYWNKEREKIGINDVVRNQN